MKTYTCLMLITLFCLGNSILSLTLKKENKNQKTSNSWANYYEHATKWNDRGQGNFWYLDRHFPNCGYQGQKKFMTAFHLDRSGDRIRYQFKCSDAPIVGNTNLHQSLPMFPTHITNFNDNPWHPRHSTQKLFRAVGCPWGQALVSFGYVRIPEEKQSAQIDGAWFVQEAAKRTDLGYNLSRLSHALFRAFGVEEKVGDPLKYVYECAEMPKPWTCVPYSNQWSYMHKGYTEYLDRQHVRSMHNNSVLQGFQLHSRNMSDKGTGDVRYTYTVCHLG